MAEFGGLKEKLDSADIGGLLERFPEMMREPIGAEVSPLSPGKVAVLAGMGGSALAGELYRDAVGSDASFRLEINRGYSLPAWVDQTVPLVAVSYSGETEETLTVFREALRRRVPMVAVSSGGTLRSEAEGAGVPWIALPEGIPARFSIVHVFRTLAEVLPGPEFAWEAIATRLEEFCRRWSDPLREGNEAVVVAEMAAAHPSLYLDQAWEGVGKVWQAHFNENAKLPLQVGFFPEFNHNEILTWTGEGERTGLFPVSVLDPETTRKRRDFALTRWEAVYGKPFIWEEESRDRALVVWALIYLGLWTSYHLALLRGFDPSDIAPIEELKEHLRES